MSEPDPKPCERCASFQYDAGHPLHARLCNRLGGRLLNPDAERESTDPRACGPQGRQFNERS